MAYRNSLIRFGRRRGIAVRAIRIRCLREKASPDGVPARRPKTNQDASPGFAGFRGIGDDAQDYILGNFQPSLAGLFLALMSTQDCGYSQPELSKLANRSGMVCRQSVDCMEPGESQRDRVGFLVVACQHSRAVQVHPGLHPGIFSAVPAGLVRDVKCYPGLTSWATISRPYGTGSGTS